MLFLGGPEGMIKRKYFEEFYRRFISLSGDPKYIARGFALGIFIGVTPTIPFHTILAIIFCFIFRQNLSAAYLGTWLISNPLTIPLFYVSQYRLGIMLLGHRYGYFLPTDYSLLTVIKCGGKILVPLLLGGFMMAPLFALIGYVLAFHLLKTRKRNLDNGTQPYKGIQS